MTTADGCGYGSEIPPFFTADIIDGRHRDGRPAFNWMSRRKNKMIDRIFEEISAERHRQEEKFGEQNHSMLGKTFDLIDIGRMYPHKDILRNQLVLCRERVKSNKHGWFDILLKEVCESFLETDPIKQREEMIQVAAVAVRIIECLDRRMGNETSNNA
jgi:hypothetical protein